MRTDLTVVALMCSVLLACSKEEDDPPAAELDDPNITVWEFEPDTMFTVGETASGIFSMDLDGDSMNDITIGLFHSYYQNGPHLYNEYQVQVTGNDSLAFMTTPYSGGGPCNGPLPLNTMVNANHSYGWNLTLFKSSIWGGYCYPYSDYGLIGFRIAMNGRLHYGWMKLRASSRSVWIDSYAIHLVPEHWIWAGDD